MEDNSKRERGKEEGKKGEEKRTAIKEKGQRRLMIKRRRGGQGLRK